MRIGEMLLSAKVITDLQLHAALAEQQRWGGKLGTILVRMGALSEDLLVMALSRQLALPRADVEQLTAVPDALRDRLDRATCERYRVLPLAWVAERRAVQLAMADPFDVVALDDLTRLLGTRLEPFLAGENAIAGAVRRLYGAADSHLAQGGEQMAMMDNAGNPLGRSPSAPPSPLAPPAGAQPLTLQQEQQRAPAAAPLVPGSFAARVDEQARAVRAVADLLEARGVISRNQLPR